MATTTHWASTALWGFQQQVTTRPYTTAAISIVVVYVVGASIFSFVSRNPKVLYPEVRSESKAGLIYTIRALDWFKNGPRLIQDGYDKYRETIFQVPSQDRTSIVLPARFLEEIRNLPSSIASNSRATSDFFFGSWTTLNIDMFQHALIEAVKIQYIAKIGQQVGPTFNEATYALNKHFHSYADWTPIAAQPKIQETVAQTVARVVVGPEVCRHPKWVESMTGYANNVFMAAVCFKMMPSILQPLVAIFTPFLYQIHRSRRSILQIVAPIIQQRLEWKRNQPESWKHYLKTGSPSSVDWLVEKYPPEKSNPRDITHGLTGISFGASHTTSSHIGNCILELAADFDRLAPALRAEIDDVLGSERVTLSNSDLSKMWKLDSFMKETQRFHPPSKCMLLIDLELFDILLGRPSQLTPTVSVNRTFVKPYSLSNGDNIAKGIHVSFPGVPMAHSEEYFDHPHDFDAFRFERMRYEQGDTQNGLQFATSSPGSLHFGYGKQMCPGRFMGGLISKIVVIQILERYDLRLRDGEKRPPNLTFMEMDAPDPTYQILIRDRKVSCAA